MYTTGGQQYLVVVGGAAGNQTTPNLPTPKGSYIMAFRVGATSPVANDTTGQSAVVAAAASGAMQMGTVPYTQAQVAAGKAAYAQSCGACHGAQLQGISAPALTGSAFGGSHLSVSALRSIVTKQMPLTAPGSLSPAAYASIMAYLAASNCVKASGAAPFPSSDQPAFKGVLLVGQSCPVK
jgi:mono/diheme cytochrome c family protein